MKIRGRLAWRDLGAGFWVVETPAGEVVVLGAVDGKLAGREVVVEGEADEGFGVHMRGEAVRVRAVRSA